MRVIVSGGGTGGHIYPAVAIIEELKKRHKDLELLYVGTKDSMEERIAAKYGYDFATIRVKGMPRSLNKKSFIALKELIHGLFGARKIVKDFKPDIVIGTGGFVTGPILLMASLNGAKTLIHEQNSLPGVTNRLLSKFVNKICVTYESSKRFFKNPEKISVTANPVRSSMEKIEKKDSSFEKYGLSRELPVVLSFGGSNGSESQNKALAELINKYSKEMNFQILHASGRDNYDEFMADLNADIDKSKLSIHPYFDDIASCYDIADLIITSSGAITLAEISSLGLASILIPKSYTTENHQEYNARLYEEVGASEMILESELTSSLLYDKIKDILKDGGALKTMGENARKLGNKNAASMIVDIVEAL